MTFTKEQRNIAYKKLRPEVQDFIMSNDTTELIGKFLKESGFSEEIENIADSEILYAMFGLQTLQDAINNIAKISNKKPSELSELENNLKNNIFNKINTDKKTVPEFNKNKIIEISKKYSLNQSQTDELVNTVAFVITNPKETEEFIDIIMINLKLSRIMAEQIVEDVNKRVINYVINKASEPEVENKEIPEIRPEIVPMVESPAEREVVQKTWGNVDTTLRQDYVVQAKPAQATQKTQFVPNNLPGIEIENEKPTAPTQNPEILSSSIQSATSFVPPKQDLSETKKTVEEKPIVKQYTIDPYREPLE